MTAINNSTVATDPSRSIPGADRTPQNRSTTSDDGAPIVTGDTHTPMTLGRIDPGAAQASCILSIDVEEYFQIEAAKGVVRYEDWPTMVSRVEGQMDWILQTLAEHQCRATFFTLGWVAQRHPKLIRRIVDAGHELACHGYAHQRIHQIDLHAFHEDIHRAKLILEDAGGVRVAGYRAPTFSLDRSTAWAVDALAAEEFVYDSSIQPIVRPAYGVPDAPRFPHRLTGPSGQSLLELPPVTWQVRNYRMPVAGGGYFRLLPLSLMFAGIEQYNRAGYPAVLYFHPWEFDPDQPRLPLSGLKKFRTYLGLRSSRKRLVKLLKRGQTTCFRDWLMSQQVRDWEVFSLAGPATESELRRAA